MRDGLLMLYVNVQSMRHRTRAFGSPRSPSPAEPDSGLAWRRVERVEWIVLKENQANETRYIERVRNRKQRDGMKSQKTLLDKVLCDKMIQNEVIWRAMR